MLEIVDWWTVTVYSEYLPLNIEFNLQQQRCENVPYHISYDEWSLAQTRDTDSILTLKTSPKSFLG